MPSEHSADGLRRRAERGIGIAAMVAALLGFALVIADARPSRQAPGDHGAGVGEMTAKPVEAARSTAASRLLGLRGDGLHALLGGADFVRSEGAVEMRRYSGSGCTLVVFLHRGADGLIVEHAESRPASAAAGPIAVSACFDGLAWQRQLAAAATATPSPEAETPRSLVR